MAGSDQLTFILFGGSVRFPVINENDGQIPTAYFVPYAFARFLGAFLLCSLVPLLWLLIPILFNISMIPAPNFSSPCYLKQYADLFFIGMFSITKTLFGVSTLYPTSLPQPESLFWRLIFGIIGLVGYGLAVSLIVRAIKICRQNKKTWERYRELIISKETKDGINYASILPNLQEKGP